MNIRIAVRKILHEALSDEEIESILDDIYSDGTLPDQLRIGVNLRITGIDQDISYAEIFGVVLKRFDLDDHGFLPQWTIATRDPTEPWHEGDYDLIYDKDNDSFDLEEKGPLYKYRIRREIKGCNVEVT